MRTRLFLTLTTLCLSAGSLLYAAGNDPAVTRYTSRVAAIVNQVIDAELSKRPELANTESMELTYLLDRTGHVQEVNILAAKPNRKGAKTMARLLKAISFPPFPKELLDAGALSTEGHLDWKRTPAQSDDSPFDRYNLRVHKLLQDEVASQFKTSARRLEVDYEFYLNARGRVVGFKTHPKAGGHLAEQIVVHAIQKLKFPPVPAAVFRELQQKPPLKIFGTFTWEPQK